jgi:hypothetical protein
LKKNHNKKKEGKEEEEAKHCNPQCNEYEWILVFPCPLVFVTL